MAREVWVVEAWDFVNEEFLARTHHKIELSAKNRCHEFKAAYPGGKHRVVRYVPAEGGDCPAE